MSQRLLAKIIDMSHSPRVKHFIGLPPSLTEGVDQRVEMEPATILVIEEKSDGVLLYRYSLDGSFVGDTWHLNIDDAQHQATFEYPGMVLKWDDVPNHVDDVVSFGLEGE
jgi:hypothetical protein